MLSASAFPSYGEDRANRVITNLKSVLTRNKKREREILKLRLSFSFLGSYKVNCTTQINILKQLQLNYTGLSNYTLLGA